MLINAAALVHIHTQPPTSTHVTLTPYLPLHVGRYHAWMQDPDIRALTASEPLTLDEEYAMQRSWRTDADKLTFIVYAQPGTESGSPVPLQRLGEDGMVGDVNLFLSVDDDHDDDDDDDDDDANSGKKAVVGELELMLAEPSARGRGLGAAVLLAFLAYVARHEREIVAEFLQDEGDDDDDDDGVSDRESIDYFRVRIAKDNVRSLRLFQGLGFMRTSAEPNYFGELELRRHPSARVPPVPGGRRWEKDVQDLMAEKRLHGWQETRLQPASS